MSETAPSLLWSDYLAAARMHLAAAKHSAETGGPPPVLPERPSEAMPESVKEEAAQLAFEYDQLSSQVARRIADLQTQLVADTHNPHTEKRLALYFDRAV